MAFTLPPRLAPPSSNVAARRPKRGGGHYVPFNKERYVNAQYRFLVKPTGDYTVYFADSDIYLNWSDILTVLIPTSSALSTASHVNALSTSQQPSLDLHEGAACPICLSPPTSPRMTKCGHVYCYPCILHYLTINEAASGASTPSSYHQHVPGASRPAVLATNSSSNSAPKWKRCPICWDAIYAKDLKAVQWWDAKAQAQEFQDCEIDNPVKQSHLCMRLIERPHLTTLALPQSSTWPNASTSTLDQPLIAQHSAPWHFQPDVMTFCKFMLATPEQLLGNLNSNLHELEEEKLLLQSFGMKDEVGLYFVEVAEKKVQEQMEKVMNELDTASVQSRIGFAKNELKEHAEIEQGVRERNEEAISKREKKRREREKKGESGNEDNGSEDVAEFLQVQAPKQGRHVDDGRTAHVEEGQASTFRKDVGSMVPKTRRNLNPPAPSSSSYLFFQASSGQNVFLHPLDIKVLLSIYGSYTAFPQTLQLLIQGADEGSMNEEIKKKCKYLTHLTKGTDIVFVEVDWEGMAKETDVPEGSIKVDCNVIKMYDQALKQRRNRKKDRERREDRAKVKWEETQQTSRPAGLGDHSRRSMEESRSPIMSTNDDLFPSSMGSASTTSPSFRQAALVGADQVFPIHPGPVSAQDEFPSTTSNRQHTRREGANSSTPRDIVPASATRKTVWGTPAARAGNFATALHNSSRGDSTAADDDAPDWDSWLELEEDFIVGARNNTSVREGRGLNRQVKKGTGGDSSSEGTKPDGNQSTASTLAKTDGKQQKKKKLVLTSGGGGRGR